MEPTGPNARSVPRPQTGPCNGTYVVMNKSLEWKRAGLLGSGAGARVSPKSARSAQRSAALDAIALRCAIIATDGEYAYSGEIL